MRALIQTSGLKVIADRLYHPEVPLPLCLFGVKTLDPPAVRTFSPSCLTRKGNGKRLNFFKDGIDRINGQSLFIFPHQPGHYLSLIHISAPVIGADDEEIAQSISVIFLFNILAALFFPTLGGALGMTNEGFGLFAGTAINDTSSVTAAASTWDTLHGTGGAVLEYATIVKLTRTLAIIPITLALAVWRTYQAKRGGGASNGSFDLKKIFPFFILFFVLASVITTVSPMAGVGAEFFQMCIRDSR